MISLDEFKIWQQNTSTNIPLIYGKIKSIGQEYRHFIIDGKVVSSSRYKLGGIVNYSDNVDTAIISYAEKIAEIWTPARAYVLDTYVTNDEMGVVELGCIGNAGFYAADIQKIIMTLTDLY